MIIEIQGETASELYEEGLEKFRICAVKEPTRNGPAMVMPGLVCMTLNRPECRVIDDPTRRANPFFHMMEFVWMMAGRQDSAWIAQFNRNMHTYANDGIIHAAYGNRWQNQFGVDQVEWVINKLKKDPGTRQAVVQLWSPNPDLTGNWSDKACNTQLMFRYEKGELNMLVINRSNDFIWGAMGANICHFTMLHETIAHFAGLPLGRYTVLSNNLHMYEGMPRFQEHWQQRVVHDIYQYWNAQPKPMFEFEETYKQFITDCALLCNGHISLSTTWMRETAYPAYVAWKVMPEYGHALDEIALIKSPDWRVACQNWVIRKQEKTLSSAT
jgi:thymidylate synthase